MAETQPPFWLEVRKEYVIENFERLLSYLKQYKYVETEENIDFDKTFSCLQAVVKEMFDETRDSNLCKMVGYLEMDEKTFIRIVASYLLVCQKKGLQDISVLSMLLDRLILQNVVKINSILDKFRSLEYHCLCQHSVARYGYTWSDIMDAENFSLEIFSCRLAETSFEAIDETVAEPLLFCEQKGVAVAQPDKLVLAPMNHYDYSKADLQVQLNPDSEVEIRVDKKDRVKLSSFKNLVELSSILSALQDGVTPSPVHHLRTYNCNEYQEEVIVRITYIDDYLHGETVDPSYEVLKGSIYVKNFSRGMVSDDLKRLLRIGDYVKVHLQSVNNIPFIIDDTFESNYQQVASKDIGETLAAVYVDDYTLGKRWLTEDGLMVNIRNVGVNESVSESVQHAIDEDLPMEIRILDAKKDLQGNFVINGCYGEDYYSWDGEMTKEVFMADAHRSMMIAFIENSKPSFEIKPEEPKEEIDPSFLLPLAHAFYKRSHLCTTSTQERYENLIIARMIAQLCEAQEDVLYIAHEMDYVHNLVRFAQGESPSGLQLTHDSSIGSNEKVRSREDVISVLRTYKENTETYPGTQGESTSEILSRLRDLVQASNILVNKISEQEINRIKKGITSVLEVEDMYHSTMNVATYYGEESDTLEFKSSIVFPAVNKRTNQDVPAEPTRQRWEILKAVCGFLNTMSGGEILLGVRDNGYSCGLKDDMDYLYQNKKIAEPTMDKLCLYVKYAVDNAFLDYNGMVTDSKDITQTRVRYVIDRNKEGDEILRIQVSPYEYGVVLFKDEENVPEGMSQSYQRSSNTTVSMNSEARQQLSSKRLSAQQDEDTLKILELQKAKKERKVVILKNYTSHSQTKDRKVEPYKLLFDRKAVICFDYDRKALREYKIQRFSSVELTNASWKNYRQKFEDFHVDLFDMLQTDSSSIHLVLKLEALPYNLLREEYTGAEQNIFPNEDTDSRQYPWILDTQVYNIQGVGRFYLGLAHHIKIVEGEALKEYVKQYIEKIKLQ